ncbi:MAG TPA: isochorismatase family protein [Thioalkalivibrio sp.]|nr:isochorismatase family protein [Thioalkalivibrio sp.]
MSDTDEIPRPTLPALCRQHDSQLLVIDIQDRLLGAMAQADRLRVLKASSALISAARLLGVPLLATEQYPRGLGATDSSLRSDLVSHGRVFEKTSFSCCGAPGLGGQLDRETHSQVVIAGIEAHVCVLQTALDLHVRGFEVFVVEDATCSRNPAHHANAMQRLRQAGVTVTNMESVLFEWMRDASHPHFKVISQLVK